MGDPPALRMSQPTRPVPTAPASFRLARRSSATTATTHPRPRGPVPRRPAARGSIRIVTRWTPPAATPVKPWRASRSSRCVPARSTWVAQRVRRTATPTRPSTASRSPRASSSRSPRWPRSNSRRGWGTTRRRSRRVARPAPWRRPPGTRPRPSPTRSRRSWVCPNATPARGAAGPSRVRRRPIRTRASGTACRPRPSGRHRRDAVRTCGTRAPT